MTGVWGHLTYDPDLDIVYYGSSGVGPASETQRGTTGATMAGTDTRWAVHPKTGEIVWRHQTLPRDNWDQECTFEMMVINTPVNPDASAKGMLSVNPNAKKGPRKTLTGVPCKTGIAWSFDAATGEFLWAKQTSEQNLVAKIDPKGQVSVNEDVVIDGCHQDLSNLPDLRAAAAIGRWARIVPKRTSCSCRCRTCASTSARAPIAGLHRNSSTTPPMSAASRRARTRSAASMRSMSRPARPCGAGRRACRTIRRCSRPGAASCSTVRMDRYLRALDADNGHCSMGNASALASGRWRHHLFRQWTAICGHIGRRRRACSCSDRYDAGSRDDDR